jgi:peptidoglycan hydrolase-like protein with peptidoglycan-binding domain
MRNSFFLNLCGSVLGRVSSALPGLIAPALLCCTLSAVAGTPLTVATGTSHLSVKHKLRKTSHSSLHHSEAPAIAAERATQIQMALIQRGYLSGEPTGTWDAQTVAAMQKLQSDNGWQSKITPDARALIKLGLGPAPVTPAAGATSSSPLR